MLICIGFELPNRTSIMLLAVIVSPIMLKNPWHNGLQPLLIIFDTAMS